MEQRELYIMRGEEQLGPYTSAEIQTYVNDGLIGQTDQLFNSTSQSYETFPSPLHAITQQPVATQQIVQQPAQVSATQQPAQPQQTIIVQQRPSGTATIAAWVLFGLGVVSQLTVLGLIIAPLFYLVSFILSIVMMAQGRAGGGIILLIVNLVIPAVLAIIQFAMFGVTFGEAVGADAGAL